MLENVRQKLGMFASWLKNRDSLDYRCPHLNCGAGLEEMRMISGFVGQNGKGKVRGKFVIRCDRHNGVHTVSLKGDLAVHVFMGLQGTEKIRRKLSRQIAMLQAQDKLDRPAIVARAGA